MIYLIKEKKNNKDNLYTLNYFKNIGNKFYSSSNNANIAKKRNSRTKKLKFTDSRYSKDEPEKDYADDVVSSLTNSSFQKI